MKYSAQREPDGRVRLVRVDDQGRINGVELLDDDDALDLNRALCEVLFPRRPVDVGTKSPPPPTHDVGGAS